MCFHIKSVLNRIADSLQTFSNPFSWLWFDKNLIEMCLWGSNWSSVHTDFLRMTLCHPLKQPWPDAITWLQWVKSPHNHQSFLTLIVTIYHFISHIPFPPGPANNLKFHKLTTSVSKTSNPLLIQFRCFTLTTAVYQFDSSLTSCHWSLIHPDWSQTATKRLIFAELATGVTTVKSRMSICWPSQELTPWHGKNWEVCKNQASPAGYFT